MGSSMSDPTFPERNRLKHKPKALTNGHNNINSHSKITIKHITPTKRHLSHPLKYARDDCFESNKINGDPQVSQLEQTPVFTNSFIENYDEQVGFDPKEDKNCKKINKIKLREIQSVLVYEDDYHLLPDKQTTKLSHLNSSKLSQSDVLEEQFKLSLNSKIKPPSEDVHITFSQAIEEQPNQKIKEPRSNRVGVKNSKINKFLQKMVKEQKTSSLLDKYLPKSKIQVKKNLDIKLVQPKRTLLGKAVETKSDLKPPQSNIQLGGKVENYYTNWKKKENKRKRSLPRIQHSSKSKNQDDQDYYEISNHQKNIDFKAIAKLTQSKLLEIRKQKRTQKNEKNIETNSNEKESVESKLSSCRSDKKINIIYF